MSRHDRRSPTTGRFVKVDTSNTALSADSKFDVVRELEIQTQGADPRDLAYDLTGRATNNAAEKYDAPKVRNDLGVKGSPLRHREDVLVPRDEHARTSYGVQGALGREAARKQPRGRIAGTGVEQDASRRLTGAE